MPRLPCEITEVFGDKVKTYMLGTIKGKFCGGDLHSYDGSVAVVRGDITLSLREATQKFNHVISSPNPAENVQVGARQISASVEKTEYSAPPSVILLQFALTDVSYDALNPIIWFIEWPPDPSSVVKIWCPSCKLNIDFELFISSIVCAL